MATDEAKRARILAAASDLFTALGFGATTLEMVAKRAGVSPRAVGRLVGDRHDLMLEVLAERGESVVADLVERAAETPERTPPLSALCCRRCTGPRIARPPKRGRRLVGRARGDPEEVLDEVKPGSAGWGEVQGDPGVLLEPRGDLGVLQARGHDRRVIDPQL